MDNKESPAALRHRAFGLRLCREEKDKYSLKARVLLQLLFGGLDCLYGFARIRLRGHGVTGCLGKLCLSKKKFGATHLFGQRPRIY